MEIPVRTIPIFGNNDGGLEEKIVHPREGGGLGMMQLLTNTGFLPL